MNPIWGTLRSLFTRGTVPPVDLEQTLATLRAKLPTPIFWLLGKTQSGKTSTIRQLTGAEDAAIGSGFRPCTRTSREYQFPTAEAPLITFLDTRGVDEPGYDPGEDITSFDPRAHLVIVTAKATDFAQGNILAALQQVRRANTNRPVVLCITCLNETIPRQPLPSPYPFPPLVKGVEIDREIPENLRRCIDEHRRAFDGLFDVCVPVDFTKVEDGFADPSYGAEALKGELIKLLPGAYRQTLIQLDQATQTLKDLHLKSAIPIIIGYTSMAAGAGTIPIPFLDLAIIPGIQMRMVNHLAKLYGQPMTRERYKELAASLGVGIFARQAARELSKLIPYVGSVVGAAGAWAATYALGRAFCQYYQAYCDGHVPNANELKKYYQGQLDAAEREWAKQRGQT